MDQRQIVIEEVATPHIGPGEVLVKNKVSTTCGTDVKNYMRGYPLLKPPHPFGHEFSGVIAAVGDGVTGFVEGDRVAVHNSAPCGSCHWCKHGQFSMCEDLLFNRGSYAEYVRVPARIVRQNMFKLPDSMSHKTASLMEPLACAVYGIENCPIEPGDFVVVNGAGPIGLMFARLAVLKGAQVLVTDISQGRLDIAERMGVWGTLNLQRVVDSVGAVRELTDDQRGADVVIEATGLIDVWQTSCQMARKGGIHPAVRRDEGRQRVYCRRDAAALLATYREGGLPHHAPRGQAGLQVAGAWRDRRAGLHSKRVLLG